MKYLIDNKNREPAYIQLYKQVRDDIVNGIYPYGRNCLQSVQYP